jgi:hypothetical protein
LRAISFPSSTRITGSPSITLRIRDPRYTGAASERP